jgi:transposase
LIRGTDRLDAAVIRPDVRPLPDATTQALGELVTRRRQIVGMITAEVNRLQQAVDQRLRKRLKAHLVWLQRELPSIEDALGTAIRNSPIWCAQADLLTSVPGVGPATAAVSSPSCRNWAGSIVVVSPLSWAWPP